MGYTAIGKTTKNKDVDTDGHLYTPKPIIPDNIRVPLNFFTCLSTINGCMGHLGQFPDLPILSLFSPNQTLLTLTTKSIRHATSKKFSNETFTQVKSSTLKIPMFPLSQGKTSNRRIFKKTKTNNLGFSPSQPLFKLGKLLCLVFVWKTKTRGENTRENYYYYYIFLLA